MCSLELAKTRCGAFPHEGSRPSPATPTTAAMSHDYYIRPMCKTKPVLRLPPPFAGCYPTAGRRCGSRQGADADRAGFASVWVGWIGLFSAYSPHEHESPGGTARFRCLVYLAGKISCPRLPWTKLIRHGSPEFKVVAVVWCRALDLRTFKYSLIPLHMADIHVRLPMSILLSILVYCFVEYPASREAS